MKKSLFFFNSNSRWYYLLRFSIILILGLAIYKQTFGFDFVFDDNDLIVSNPYIKNLNNLHYMWSYVVKTRLVGIYSLAMNYHFFHLNPSGYHVFNFLIHLITVGLVWATAQLLFKIVGWIPSTDPIRKELPYIIALIFLVHPGQTQAVTYIAQRFESMATLFYFTSIFFYLKARTNSTTLVKISLFALSGISALLGIFTKETTVTIPFMIVALELMLWSEYWKMLIKSKTTKLNTQQLLIAGILIGVGFFLIFMKTVKADLTIFFQTITSDSHDGDIISPQNYFLTQMRVFLTFLRLLILPMNQNLDYDYPMSIGILQPPLTLVGILLIGIIIGLIIKLRKNQPIIALGLAWLLITFSINLAPRRNIIFEHKLYLLNFGFFLAFITSLYLLIRNRILFLRIIAYLIITFSIISFYRNQVWQNQITLWEDVVKKSPHKSRAYSVLGGAYLGAGQLDQGIGYLNKAIVLSPSNYLNYVSRAQAYMQKGSLDQAQEDLEHVIKLHPNSCSAHRGIGRIFELQGKYDQAFKELDISITLDPSYPEGFIQRAQLSKGQGKIKEAMQDYQQALQIDPYNFDALNGLGQIHFEQGQFELAIDNLTRIIKSEPNNPSAYNMRASCLIKINKQSEALKDIETARDLISK